MWPIFIGAAALAALAFAALGGKRRTESAPAVPDEVTEPETEPETEDETDDTDDTDETDETSENENGLGADDYDDAVYVDMDAQRAKKRRVRVPKVKP